MSRIEFRTAPRGNHTAASLAARLMANPSREAKAREEIKMQAEKLSLHRAIQANDWPSVKKWLDHCESNATNPWSMRMTISTEEDGKSVTGNVMAAAFYANAQEVFIELVFWSEERKDGMAMRAMEGLNRSIEFGSMEDPQWERAAEIYAKILLNCVRSVDEADDLMMRMQRVKGTRSHQIVETAVGEKRAQMEKESLNKVGKMEEQATSASRQERRARL